MANSTDAKKRKKSSSEEDETSADSGPSRKKVRWNGGGDPDSDSESEVEVVSDAKADKVYAATACHGSRVAAAYYNPESFTIFILEDTQENKHYDLIRMFLEHARPDVILTSWKADDTFIDALRGYADANDATISVRLAREFAASRGRDRLFSLELFSNVSLPNVDSVDLQADDGASSLSDASGLRDAYSFMHHRRESTGVRDPSLVQWRSRIRLGSYATVDAAPLCIACVGALLDHIARERAFGELQDEGVKGIDVRAIESVALEQVMHLNADALHSLQVFDAESHASVHSDKTKEGLSLFAILDTTSTTLGRSLLRNWLMRPSCSLSTIAARHAAVALFIRPENATSTDTLRSNLKGLRQLPRCIARIKAGKGQIREWQGLVKLAFHAAVMYDALRELHGATTVQVVQELFTTLDVERFREIGAAVNETIDWEESVAAARICVRSRVDDELDNMKHTYNGIDSVLSAVAEQMWAFLPEEYVPSLNVVYFPQLGFLVCVPYMEEWKTETGINVLEGWTFQVDSLQSRQISQVGCEQLLIEHSHSSNVYFKSPQMHDLDKYVGDLHSNIVDREIEIIQGLAERVLPAEDVIAAAADACAELDVLLALSAASRAFDYRQPQMVEQDIIHIIGGRHPLQEQVVDTFVPNDLALGGDSLGEVKRMVICTGANACGKSVYLKQIALIQILAQIGCFVPAEEATLGVVDKIFTRIQTRESVSKSQSAFMIDLNQVSLALRNATSQSLVLLDEFGKGTLAYDGAGLFTGVIKHLLARGPDCPKVLAATHFHDVFTPGQAMLDVEEMPATFVHMQVLLSLEDDALYSEDSSIVSSQERLTYLYRVAPGLVQKSYAAHCAETYGIPRGVTQRAEHVSGLVQRHEIAKLLDEGMSEEEQRDLVHAEEVCRRFLAIDLTSDEGKVEVLANGITRVLSNVLNTG